MVDAIAIIGQDNAEILWTTSSPTAPVANANTFMRAPPIGAVGAWVPPAQSLAIFGNSLQNKLGGSIYLLPGAVTGSGLLAPAVGQPFYDYWLDPLATGLVARFLTFATGTTVKAVWYVQGEKEALVGNLNSPSTFIDDYFVGLVTLHGNLASGLGTTREMLPMFVTALGNSSFNDGVYAYARQVLAAQYQSGRMPTMFVGPEHFDLLTSDGLHLNEIGRNTFAARAGEMIGNMLAMQVIANPIVPELTFATVVEVDHNFETSLNNASYRSVVSGLLVGGTSVRVRFCAHNSLPLQIRSASIGVRSEGPNTVSTPRQLTFGGSPTATINDGDKLFSDNALLTFSASDELLVTLDLALTEGNFRMFIGEDAPMGGCYSWLGLHTYNLATPPTNGLYASNVDAAGFDLVEAAL